MGLNDEREKLKQAGEWLSTCDQGSKYYKAAWEHILWLLSYTTDARIRTEAQQIGDAAIRRYYSDVQASQ